MCKIVMKKSDKKNRSYKQKLGVNNVGSTVVEMCLIMPIIVSICVIAIMLFFDSINDATLQSNAYSSIYSYDGVIDEQSMVGTVQAEMKRVSVGKLSPKVSLIKKKNIIGIGVLDGEEGRGAYTYKTRNVEYETEFDVCTKRLRGWQFYGDTFCE